MAGKLIFPDLGGESIDPDKTVSAPAHIRPAFPGGVAHRLRSLPNRLPEDHGELLPWVVPH